MARSALLVLFGITVFENDDRFFEDAFDQDLFGYEVSDVGVSVPCAFDDVGYHSRIEGYVRYDEVSDFPIHQTEHVSMNR